MCLTPYANNKGADQPAHPRSLISAFVVRSLDSIISLVSRSEISRFQLVSVAEQAGLNVTRSQTSEDTFSRDGAQMVLALMFVAALGLCLCPLFYRPRAAPNVTPLKSVFKSYNISTGSRSRSRQF